MKGAAIPSPPGLDKDGPSLHHHHVPVSRPHHHHHHGNAKPAVQANPQLPLPNITIVSSAVLDSVKNLPRRHLGHCYYESKLKPTSSTVYPKKGRPGYSSTPKPLPRFENSQLNCTYTVKVPRIYLNNQSLREITSRKSLWGTDIYTDDSDVVAAGIHAGWFRGAWDESVDVSLLGLDLSGKTAVKQRSPNGDETLLQPPPAGPQNIPKNHDVHIDIVVLPLLEGYGSTIRFGIKSREWGIKREGHQGQHDGMSFMIVKVAFVSSVGDGGGTGIRKRKKMIARPQETVPEDKMVGVLNGDSAYGESIEGETSGDIKGIGTNSWWKEPEAVKITEKKLKVEEEPVKSSPPPPRTPPRQEPPRHYVPIDPPIPSPISVIDPQIDIERAAELLAESANATPSKATGEDTVMEEIISPPRPVPDMETAVPPPMLPRRGSQREIIIAGHGFGGDVEVKREIINTPIISAPAPVVEEIKDDSVPVNTEPVVEVAVSEAPEAVVKAVVTQVLTGDDSTERIQFN